MFGIILIYAAPEGMITLGDLMRVFMFLSPLAPLAYMIHRSIKTTLLNALKEDHKEMIDKIDKKESEKDQIAREIERRVLSLEIIQEERSKTVSELSKKIDSMNERFDEIKTTLAGIAAKMESSGFFNGGRYRRSGDYKDD